MLFQQKMIEKGWQPTGAGLFFSTRGGSSAPTVAATDETFKKASESKKKHGEQKELGV